MTSNNRYQELISADEILVYGAKLIAREAIEDLQMICPKAILGCAVSSMEGNALEVLGVPVDELDAWKVDKEKVCVLVALGNQYYESVKKNLVERQYSRLYSFDSELRNQMFKKMVQAKLKQFREEE